MKFLTGAEFYNDLDADAVQEEFIKAVRMIYAYRIEEKEILSEARNEDHIMDQWTFLRNNIPFLHEKSQPLVFRLVMRAVAAPNARTGCERANSDYNITKTKLSSSMK